MPCQSGPYPDDTERRRADRLENMLCQMCTYVEGSGQEVPSPVWSWWQKHKERDAARRRKEQAEAEIEALREKALAKLDPHEREVLGLR